VLRKVCRHAEACRGQPSQCGGGRRVTCRYDIDRGRWHGGGRRAAPGQARDSLHRSATWTGIGFLVFAALNGAVLLPAGRVADTLGRRPVMVAGCAVSAAGLLLLAVLPGQWAYLGALAVAGAGSGLLDVAPSAMLGDLLSAQGRQGGILVAF